MPEHCWEGCSPGLRAAPDLPPLTTQPSSAPPTPSPWHLHGPRGWWLISRSWGSVFSSGTCQPVVVVFPDGRAGSRWRAGPSAPLPSLKAQAVTITEATQSNVRSKTTLVLLILSHTLRLGWSTLHRGFSLLDFCQQHPLARGSLLSTTSSVHREPHPPEPSGCGSLALGFLSSGGGSSWAVMLRTSWGQCAQRSQASPQLFPTGIGSSHHCWRTWAPASSSGSRPDAPWACTAFSSPVPVIVYPRFGAQEMLPDEAAVLLGLCPYSSQWIIFLSILNYPKQFENIRLLTGCSNFCSEMLWPSGPLWEERTSL